MKSKKRRERKEKGKVLLKNSNLIMLFIIIKIVIRFPESFILEMLKYKLSSKLCSLTGYILDGFPKNYDQANLLFESNYIYQTINYFFLLYIYLLDNKLCP